MNKTNEIQLNNITYKSNNKKILDDISFKIYSDEIVALLGHNGCGKSTLFEIMTGIIGNHKNSISFGGKTFKQNSNKIGVVWDNISMFSYLKVSEVIKYISSMMGNNSINKNLYHHLEIKKFENNLMRHLSQGEKKRVAIYIATLNNPEYLLLDEATSELDPLSRDIIWSNIFLKECRTIMFSTHLWEEAEKYATKIIFMANGKILNKPSSIASLRQQSDIDKKVIVDKNIILKDLNVTYYQTDHNNVFLIPNGDDITIKKIKSQTNFFSILPITLEDIYNDLVKKSKL